MLGLNSSQVLGELSIARTVGSVLVFPIQVDAIAVNANPTTIW